MKIQVISDLHQEFGVSDLSFDRADLVILAGDVNVGIKGIEWIKKEIKTIPVIYVLGNHEYYRGSYPKTLKSIKELGIGTNVHVLENDSIVIDGITFHGATMWTDFALLGDSRFNGAFCQEKMNDYRLIRRDPSYSKLRSIDTFLIHKHSCNWLESSLENSSTKINIVITHHAPSINSVPVRYKDDILSSAYASNLEPMILKYKPQYWIHGHIHDPAMYDLGKTTIICNPHGYLTEPYNGFDKNLTIEL